MESTGKGNDQVRFEADLYGAAPADRSLRRGENGVFVLAVN